MKDIYLKTQKLILNKRVARKTPKVYILCIMYILRISRFQIIAKRLQYSCVPYYFQYCIICSP